CGPEANIAAPEARSPLVRVLEAGGLARRKTFEVAEVIGHDPTVFLASQFVPGIDVDEFTIAGALRKAPVELVPCEMVNIELPATSAGIIRVPSRTISEVGDEGPYGEFCGYLVGTVIRGRLTA